MCRECKSIVILQMLPSNLGLFAYTFLRRALNLGQPSDRNGKPNVAEVNNVLSRHLCADQRGNHIFTFGTLELENLERKMCWNSVYPLQPFHF